MTSPLLLSTFVLLAGCLVQGEQQIRVHHVHVSDNEIGVEAAKTRSLRGGSIIDPSASVDPSAHMGSGCIVKAHARVGFQAWLGNGCIISENCVVGNHARVGGGAIMLAGSQLRPYSSLCDGCIMQPGEVR